MRFLKVSIFAVIAAIPTFADARLPVVNVGAGAVSARAAFGESAPVTVTPLEQKAVVARSAKASVKVATAATTDVLKPKRPSNDLWAKNEKPLRLPQAEEFAVIKSDYELPEEYLDGGFVAAAAIPVISDRVAVLENKESVLDNEIAKLVELQRRADESIRVAGVKTPTSISSYDIKPSVIERAAKVPQFEDVSVRRDYAPRETVSVARVVVPMESDVVVRAVQNNEPKFTNAAETDLAKMSPGELKKAFKKTYLSENKHLSAYQIDDRFDVVSDTNVASEGFTSMRDLSESGGIRPLEIKIGFRGEDSALSRDNYNLLSEYAAIVASNPKRAIQVSIPESATRSTDGRKLAARRLAIVEQVLNDTGVSGQRIMPVLSQRNDESFVLRVISSDQFESMTQQKRDMFGDSVGKKSYKSMTW